MEVFWRRRREGSPSQPGGPPTSPEPNGDVHFVTRASGEGPDPPLAPLAPPPSLIPRPGRVRLLVVTKQKGIHRMATIIHASGQGTLSTFSNVVSIASM